jgi:hypothetical protein
LLNLLNCLGPVCPVCLVCLVSPVSPVSPVCLVKSREIVLECEQQLGANEDLSNLYIKFILNLTICVLIENILKYKIVYRLNKKNNRS